MNPYITGGMIREMREKRGFTQAELAQKLMVSDKTVSKWETGKGYPDITLLEPIANVFGISITELLSGNAIQNRNRSGNMFRSSFYVCPVCGNILHSMGEAAVMCHGIGLMPLAAEPADEAHRIRIERVEDTWFVQVSHEMTRNHHISFMAACSLDRCQLVKLYPEGKAEAGFTISGVKRIYYFCNKDGLFCHEITGKRR